MPLYEYECQSCGRRREELQRFSDPPLDICDECGGPLRRLISAPTVQFKGSGWYVTDYAGRKSGSEGEKEGGKKEGDGKEGAGEKEAGKKEGGGKEGAGEKKSAEKRSSGDGGGGSSGGSSGGSGD